MPLESYFKPPSLKLLLKQAPLITALCKHHMNQEFNLLGSGWVRVTYDTECAGRDGARYSNTPQIPSLKNTNSWINTQINRANTIEAQRRWSLISDGYTPIDWQLDFISGFRWDSKKWHGEIQYGQIFGVDIKVPWELARFQHLTIFVWSYIIWDDRNSFNFQRDAIPRHFRNQILDFISCNPPGFGVNWRCTMDVAIRVSNWLVNYDLFRAAGYAFDAEFNLALHRSVFEHANFIANNLEYSPGGAGNHYLSDIVGLLFCAAYLPSTTTTNSWLAFAIQELLSETKKQFHLDGTNFEASTAYHRLALELITYAASLCLLLPQHRRQALKSYTPIRLPLAPALREVQAQEFAVDQKKMLPDWFWQRLEDAAGFIVQMTGADSYMPQIGDNDSGRFLKLDPMSYARINEEMIVDEYVLDYRHVVAAVNGILKRQELIPFTYNAQLEQDLLINSLSETADALKFAYSHKLPLAYELHSDLPHFSKEPPQTNWQLCSYPDFGAFIYRQINIKFVIRCGPIGQKGNGGHAHNDTLSFVMSYSGIYFFIDPGTYVYTCNPERRNFFRSTHSHSTLTVAGLEQNDWKNCPGTLFALKNQANARAIQASNKTFIGEHAGYGSLHRRSFNFMANSVQVEDFCQLRGDRSVLWMVAPNTDIKIIEHGKVAELKKNGICLRLVVPNSVISEESTLYSRGYGLSEPSLLLRSPLTENTLLWTIEWQA